VAGAPTESVKYLLDNGGDANEHDKRNQTLLMQAVLAGVGSTIDLLLNYGADKEAKNINGHTAYDMAKQSSTKVRKMFL